MESKDWGAGRGALLGGAIGTAEQLVKTLGAKDIVAEDMDANVAGLFAAEEAPTPDPEPDATPSSSAATTG